MASLTQKARGIAKGISNTGTLFAIIGAVMLFVMMAVGAADVIGRYLFNNAILGVLEISRILMAGLVVFCWAYTQANRAHARVGVIVDRFPPRVQAIMTFAADLLMLVFFGLIAWQGAKVGMVTWEAHKVLQIIRFPVAVMQFAVSLGACVTCLLLITQLASYRFSRR